jgi:HEAT repeat protein
MNNKLLIRKLREAVEIKNEEAIEELVQKIGLAKIVEAVPYLITLLNETDNCKLRNIIALALADIGEQRALEPLISLIKSKRTERCRGTLVYALQSLDCASILVDLVDLVINGGFEVSCEAFYAIESIRTAYSSKD